jgi:hypothetical protein
MYYYCVCPCVHMCVHMCVLLNHAARVRHMFSGVQARVRESLMPRCVSECMYIYVCVHMDTWDLRTLVCQAYGMYGYGMYV